MDESFEAWDQQRDQMLKPIDGLCKTVFNFTEKLEDNTAAMQGALPFVGEWLVETHCSNLQKLADQSKDNGRLLASDHYLKRELNFAGWTLGYDHSITSRVRKELQLRENKIPPQFGSPIVAPTWQTPVIPTSPRFDFGKPRGK